LVLVGFCTSFQSRRSTIVIVFIFSIGLYRSLVAFALLELKIMAEVVDDVNDVCMNVMCGILAIVADDGVGVVCLFYMEIMVNYMVLVEAVIVE